MLMINKKKLYSAMVVILTFMLSGCNLIILEPKGMIAVIEKNILITSVLLMLLVVIPVIVLTLSFAWRYREGNNKATYAPEWSHNTLLEVVWWSIPCIIIAILGTITYISSHTLDPYRPISSNTKPINIQVVALQWKWLFIYPEHGITTVNYVQFPVDVPVQFTISSEGAMNSFHIPQLGSQIYAMAGMQTKLNLIANEKGDYRGLSTNFSGQEFSAMKFTAHVGSQAEFNQWVETVKQSTEKFSLMTYNELAKPSIVESPLYFSTVGKNIFDMVVMKAMMPISFEEMAKCDQHTLIALKNKNYKGIGYAQ